MLKNTTSMTNREFSKYTSTLTEKEYDSLKKGMTDDEFTKRFLKRSSESKEGFQEFIKENEPQASLDKWIKNLNTAFKQRLLNEKTIASK